MNVSQLLSALHDTSVEGRRPVNLSEFLDEVEDVLMALGLP